MTVSALPALEQVHPGIAPELLERRWTASWARHPDETLRQRTGVFLYRNTLRLETVPASFLVHMSADQRYRLYVNGVSVSWGPARADLAHWRFETVDLAPYLRAGENTLAAVVHWFGEAVAPVAQMTLEAAFLIQGNSEAESAVNTPGNGWKVWHDDSYSFSIEEADSLRAYCVIGPSEMCDGARHPWGWRDAGFDDSAWVTPRRFERGANPRGARDGGTAWWLVPRSIPAMEETPVAFGEVKRAEGIAVPEGWPCSGAPLTIPAKTKAVLLIDHGVETCAFPEITVSGGVGASIRIAYAEALFADGPDPIHTSKGNRGDYEGRVLRGYSDTWKLGSNASEKRLLRPLWWKTFRWAELTVETGSKPVTIDSLSAIYTGYPFAARARFESPEMPDAPALREIGWRTARLCAHETYMDCPYYEQLQYAGDTRIQCLVSLYESGDHRLFRSALAHLDASRIPNGLTQSRYPSALPQMISPFSLWYIGMVHDYWRHVPGDDDFVRGLLPGIRGILQWFRDQLRDDDLMGPLQWWSFVDWCDSWPHGEPPGVRGDGGSAILTLQYIIALREAADLHDFFDQEREGRLYHREAERIARAVRRQCFDSKRDRMADTPEKKIFSQHAGILAVLADAIPEKQRKAVVERVLTDKTLTQATFYCRFYLNRAMSAVGMGDEWLGTLGPWRKMRDIGLTTWAEKPEPTRSDCHAWSAAPNYELLATVLGVQPAAPGFSAVAIRPALGDLKTVSGAVPHPLGEVAVSYQRKGDRLEATVDLPKGVPAFIEWKGDKAPVKGGKIVLKAK